MAAAASGKQLDSNTIDSANPGNQSSNQVSIDEGEFVTGQESTVDDLLPGSGDNPEDSQDPASGPASSDGKQKPGISAKEIITVTDENGRRRKVEIDYSDRKAIKKAYEMSSGARKWQAERDQARQAHTTEKKALSEMKANWDALEGAFQKSGIEGLVDLLEGRPGAFKSWEKRVVDRAKFLENASPEEIQALEARETANKSQKELERIRKENEDFRKQVTQERETAELRSLEARVTPVFDRYRFADKLDNADDEQMFDEMLWNSALKRLEPYEEKGLDISPELVEREFRAVASALRKRIGVQAEKRASRALDQKKQEATEHVQTQVMSGYKSGGVAKEARDLIDGRNLTGLLKNWGKYGGVFRK